MSERTEPAPATEKRPRPWLRLRYVVPAVVFVALAAALGWGLTRNPEVIPSALIDKPVPEFDLPPVKGRTLGLKSADLEAGEVSLVNVFASWCVACRVEHPLLMEISRERLVHLYGIDYKDRPDDAARWLDRMGDPYERTGADIDGRVAIDWGVYGVPETFVVSPEGRIVYKHIGPITRKDWEETLLPLIERARR